MFSQKRELTLLEYDIFCSVEAKEFIKLAWQQKDKKELSPNITRLIKRFNEV